MKKIPHIWKGIALHCQIHPPFSMLRQSMGTSVYFKNSSKRVYSVLGDQLDCAKLLISNGASVLICDFDGRTPLHWAAYQGSHKCVKLLLYQGADWKAKDSKGRTPLHFAASHHSPKCLSVLLKKVSKADSSLVDDPDHQSMTPLHWGASYGNTEHVKLLLKAKASVKVLDFESKTPLHWATTCKNNTIVKLILDQTAAMINWQDVEGRTALHLAVARQNEAVVKTLLGTEKCDPSVQDNMGRTPLHWATVIENIRILKMLLRKGADCNLVDNIGATVLHYAAQGDFSETVEVLLASCDIKDTSDDKGRTALMWAAGKGAIKALEAMLRHNLDVHETDSLGRTALHIAAYSGDVKCVEILIKYGASVNALDSLNHTPLFRACEMGYADVVNLLKENKAILDLEDQDGRTPIHWAALNGHFHICSILVRNGVPVNRGDKLGCTPLHCAAYGGFVNCMSLLIDNGADVNKLDEEGTSAFHWSCSSGHLEAVKLLFRMKAFPNYTKLNEERLTPLDFAIIGDHQDVAQYMIEQGGLTFRAIQDVAATTIQSCWRGYRVRKPFQKRKNLYVRHEQLKRDMKRKSSLAKEELKLQIKEAGILTEDNFSRSLKLDNGEEPRGQAEAFSSELCGLSQDIANHKDSESVDLDSLEGNYSQEDSDFEGKPQLKTPPVGDDFELQISEEPNLPTILERSFSSQNSSVIDGLQDSMHVLEGIKDRKSTVENILEIDEESIDYCKNEKDGETKCVDSNDGTVDSLPLCSEVKTSAKHSSCIDSIENQTSSKTYLHVKAHKQRERRELIRSKMQAASTIQRCYKRYRNSRQPKTSLFELQNDQEELVKQIAALTIQLWWRKYLCRQYHHNHTLSTRDESHIYYKDCSNNATNSSKLTKGFLHGSSTSKRKVSSRPMSNTKKNQRFSVARRKKTTNKIRPSIGNRVSKTGDDNYLHVDVKKNDWNVA